MLFNKEEYNAELIGENKNDIGEAYTIVRLSHIESNEARDYRVFNSGMVEYCKHPLTVIPQALKEIILECANI